MNRNGNDSSSSDDGGDDDLLGVDRDGRVLDDRVEDVGGDLGVVVPVAGVVAEAGEDELGGARPALGDEPMHGIGRRIGVPDTAASLAPRPTVLERPVGNRAELARLSV